MIAPAGTSVMARAVACDCGGCRRVELLELLELVDGVELTVDGPAAPDYVVPGRPVDAALDAVDELAGPIRFSGRPARTLASSCFVPSPDESGRKK